MLGLRVAASVYEHKLEQDDDQMRMRASVVELHGANHKNVTSSDAGDGAADATLSVHLHGLGKLVAANLGGRAPQCQMDHPRGVVPSAGRRRHDGASSWRARTPTATPPGPWRKRKRRATAHHDARHQHGVPTTPACTYMLAETANALGADFHDPYHGGLVVYVRP